VHTLQDHFLIERERERVRAREKAKEKEGARERFAREKRKRRARKKGGGEEQWGMCCMNIVAHFDVPDSGVLCDWVGFSTPKKEKRRSKNIAGEQFARENVLPNAVTSLASLQQEWLVHLHICLYFIYIYIQIYMYICTYIGLSILQRYFENVLRTAVTNRSSLQEE